MAPKFTLGIDKMKATDVGRAAGHNCRLHPTESQLPSSAWFTPQGRHEVMPWRPEVLDQAKGLMKRKDAVVALSFIVQVGAQGDWREKPTEECPEGPPKPKPNNALNALIRGAKLWAIREFGEENIVGIDLHTDESSPHIHVVVTPVRDGKLQAKAWLDGSKSCAQLRRRAWEAVNSHFPCTYTLGAAGGAPHDASLAAGKAGQLAKKEAELLARDRDSQFFQDIVRKSTFDLDEKRAALQEWEEMLEAKEQAIKDKVLILIERERAAEALRAHCAERAEELEASAPTVLKNERNRLRALIAAIPEAVIRELPDKNLRQAIRGVQEAQQDKGLGY